MQEECQLPLVARGPEQVRSIEASVGQLNRQGIHLANLGRQHDRRRAKPHAAQADAVDGDVAQG